MARHSAIATASETLRQILDETRESEGLSGDVELFDVSSFQKPNPLAEGLSIFLYRIKQSNVQRNRHMPPDLNGNSVQPPLPLDLHYLLTAWHTSSVLTQHQLLGWGMRVLANYSTLTAALLNHYSVGEDNIFKHGETLELSYDSLSLDDMNTVTEPLRPTINPSAAYIVRVVYLDSTELRIEAPDAQTRIIELGTKELDA